MPEEPDKGASLLRARLLLEEGQREKALAVLEAICSDSEAQRQERAYLLGWYYTLAKRWDDAFHALAPLSKFLEEEKDVEGGPDRERRAFCLLRLGQIAVQFALYEDASRHYTKCLKALQDKRISLPLVKIKARSGLGMAYNMRGLYATAIEHYEIALSSCLCIDDADEMSNVYFGLCDTYRRAGDLIKAQLTGEKALQLYERSANRAMEGQMHHTLGRISFLLGNYRDAADHYTEALALSKSYSDPAMIMINYAALADVRLAEGCLEEAKQYCQLAQDAGDCVKDEQLRGVTYLIAGKVAQAEARVAEDEQKQRLLEEAIEWYAKAKKELSPTQAYTDVAELYGRWAEVLEESGQLQEAVRCWKSGYEALSTVNGQTWY